MWFELVLMVLFMVLLQVNGKLYPLAKIQLGKMGALHPANRLAAYLTGRVGSNKKQQVPSSSKPPQNQGSRPARQTALPASCVVPGPAVKPPPRSQPSVKVLTIPTTPTGELPQGLTLIA